MMVLSGQDTRQALAFGVTWQSVVSAKSRAKTEKEARQLGATHVISREQQIGYGRLLSGDLAPGERLYPAAAIAARRVGTGICLLRLHDDSGSTKPGYWLATVRNSAPTSLDKLFLSEAEAVSQALEVHSSWNADGLKIGIYSNTDIPGHIVQPLDPVDLLSAIDQKDGALQPIARNQSIPKPVLIGLALTAAAVLAMKGIEKYHAKKRAAAIAAATASNAVDPVFAWKKAVEEWASTTAAPQGNNGQGILKAREALGQAPAVWNGWILERANCTATAAISAVGQPRQWGCKAFYSRGLAAAVTRDLKESTPAGWQMQFLNLSNAVATWSFSESTVGLDVARLQRVEFHQVETASLLQPLRAALTDEIPFNFEPVVIQPPLDEKGTAIPPPPEAPVLRRLLLTVKGPLRSLDALVSTKAEVDWTELHLHSIQPYPDGNIEPGLKSSLVVAEIKGVLYATQ